MTLFVVLKRRLAQSNTLKRLDDITDSINTKNANILLVSIFDYILTSKFEFYENSLTSLTF